jgi:hypothetical protein
MRQINVDEFRGMGGSPMYFKKSMGEPPMLR